MVKVNSYSSDFDCYFEELTCSSYAESDLLWGN